MANTQDVEYDEYCDPNNPRKIKYDDILAAYRRITGYVLKTPCTRAHMSDRLGMEIYLKQEFMQHTGCFKERGVRNTMLLLSEEQRKVGVISASTGNHGTSMSYHTTQMGIPCIVVMPVRAPITKLTKCQNFGAKTIQHGDNMAEAKHYAMALSKEKKLYYVNGYDHPNVIEGQGTIGIEIIEQVPDVDAVIVPVGGGSLLCGIAVAVKHLKPDTEVYGIQTEKAYSMVEALKRNERVKIVIDSTIADGLGVNLAGVNTFHNLKSGILDKMVIVKEDWVARAIMHVVEEERYVIEGAAAVTIAAVMAGLFPNLKGKKVVCVLSGGNIDTTILARSLERGMAAEGRLVKFKVTVSDRPGGMAELCSLLATIGVTVRDCIPERAWVKGDVFSVEMKVIVETRGWDHTKELIEQIKKKYKECFFHEMSERSDKGAGAKRGPCLAPNPVCMQK
ncbi:L-threonine ammonia-lyase-like [Danaus plexippus]|uniref:L-threonine ammonia-lyase-like n=1 Tax=Danaus plexippus TaxID=13037 RepID=UPI0013C4DB88|nr:L-threonine ammonia-lyase-like [Danaus plexippus]XP_061384488.1 L-threonine ammonia-lyase-like [Danaus plexippus]